MKQVLVLQALCAIILSSLSITPFCAASSLHYLGTTSLGPDPQTTNRLNGESFQQDGLVSFNGKDLTHPNSLTFSESHLPGFQYAASWQSDPLNASVRHATISRRSLASGSNKFESIILLDYNQTEDDGHDIISFGVSPTDGTLHMIFDQHDNPLRYRTSIPGVATHPSEVTWTPNIFQPIIDFLPGLDTLDKSTHFINITYPRFLRIPSNARARRSLRDSDPPDLLLELRVGRSGLGDDWIYHYYPGVDHVSSAKSTGRWELVGRYLLGVNNNAYINGLDFDLHGNLHTTWTYRDFINDTGKDVAVQAGPNGPENNHDLNYAFSPDLGFTWKNTWGQSIADLRDPTGTSNASSPTDAFSNVFIDNMGLPDLKPHTPIQPNSPGIVIFGIPKFGGILNQESQTVDPVGRIHVLNRENTTGVERWYHYWRSTGDPANWTRAPLPLSIAGDANNITASPTVIGKRGKLVSVPPKPHSTSSGTPSETTLLAILPSNGPNSTGLTILQSTARNHFRDWSVAWQASSGCGWEPLFDRYRLESDGVLSLYLVNGSSVSVTDIQT